MLAAVAVAKIAGIATLLILAWVMVKIVRGGRGGSSAPGDSAGAADAARPEASPDAPPDAPKGPVRDPVGETIMRGFSWMLTLGVGAAFAISLGEVLAAL